MTGSVGQAGPQKRPRLYHYTDAKGLMGIVETGTIRASHADFLNDSLELKHGESTAQKVLSRIRNEYVILDAPRDGTEVFLASFSEEPDLLSQWRAYAEDGLGYSIGFSPELDLTFGGHPVEIARVLYDQDEQERLIESAWRQDPNTNLHRLFPRLKNPGFREEKEWRAIASFPYFATRDRGHVGFVESKYGLKPYLELKPSWWSIAGNPLPIAEIVLGPKIEPSRGMRALSYVLDAHGYSMVRDREPDPSWTTPCVKLSQSKVSYR